MTKSPLTLGYIRGAYIEGRTPYLRDTNPQLTAEEAKEQAIEESEEWLNAWDLRVRTDAWDSAVNTLIIYNPYRQEDQ